jgi:threonine/homoserine/homoserine lactone efflux protein
VSVETWLAFCVTETVLCLTPGPAVLFVVSVALARGAGAGLGAAFGILAANALYFALSAAGIGAVLLASHEVFGALEAAGAAYLVILGLRMLLARGAPAADAPSGAPLRAGSRPFVRGFLVQGANPKSIVFFTALLPQFLSESEPVARQVLVLGASSVAIELGVLALYAAAAARAGRVAGRRLAEPLSRVGGALLVGAGLRLAAVRE